MGLPQFGYVAESTYGTPVVVTKFFDLNAKDSIDVEYETIRSEGFRASAQGMITGSSAPPYLKRCGGTISCDVPTKTFGGLLTQLMGSVATVGPTDSNYTHTFTWGSPGSLNAKSVTVQLNRPFEDLSNQAMTYHGGKVLSAEFSIEKDGLLQASIEFDFEDFDTSTALATASYSDPINQFNWVGASMTVGGSAVELLSCSVKIENPMDVDRRRLRTSALKKEPRVNGRRMVSGEIELDWTSVAQLDRVRAATEAGARTAIVLTCNGPVAHAGTTLPQFTLTVHNARLMSIGDYQSSGFEPSTQRIAFEGEIAPATEMCTITYRTTDATP